MSTIRGFVQRLEVGRAGLVTVSVQLDDHSTQLFQIPDIDADPERFNERLSKFGILRDAMTRAEPVEIEYDDKDERRQIQRVVRITRDVLYQLTPVERSTVFVVGLNLVAENLSGPSGEKSDYATVSGMRTDGGFANFVLQLQTPERVTAQAQLDMIRAAQAQGTPLTFVYEAKTHRILGVEVGDTSGASASGDNTSVDGFVESLIVAPGQTPMGLAIVEFTTAPPFAGAGNVVELDPFVPELVRFLVAQGSAEYALFEAGLRDRLRMRVLAGPVVGRDNDEKPPITHGDDTGKATPRVRAAAANDSAGARIADVNTDAVVAIKTALVRGVQLLTALASASRPVWLRIARQSLDDGPDGSCCTDGLPTSDLTPKGLRDLQIPYTAQWVGCGCFNHGVYRLQFELGVEFEVLIDDKAVCVHASDDGKTKFAHACLGGEHTVCVVLHRWTCRQVFRMDVYRIR